MKSYSEYRAEARQALEGNWGDAALITLVYFVISGILGVGLKYGVTYSIGGGTSGEAAGTGVNFLGSLVMMPISFGFIVAFLHLKRGAQIQVKDLFAFYNGRVFLTMLLKIVYVTLWTLLLFIPGIIKSYSYAMTEYIMLDDPEIKNNAAIEKSMAMMKGHKWNLFVLDLTFIGWVLLALLTCGLGFILLEPYMYTARAAFYEEIKAEQ